MFEITYQRYDKFGYEIKGWDYLSNHFWRFFSIPIARLLTKTTILPEQVLFFSFSLGLAAAILYSLEFNNSTMIGSLLFSFFWLFDYVDGDLARLKSKISYLGDWLDSLAGKIVTVFVYIGVAIHCSHTEDSVVVWILVYLLLGAYYIFGMLEKKIAYIKQKIVVNKANEGDKIICSKRSIMKFFVHEIANGQNNLYFFLIIGGLLNKLYETLIFSLIYAWLFVLLIVYLNYREIVSWEKKCQNK